ncbi:TonB periplasmic protein [Acetobacter malorum]|uniref:Energy transducer TonB n=1 Tax=Acetobacter malorum TaxID=178901 RepID=A0A177G724_9PROT|nr:energy transducer TonB [Acetobacter malorum]OAG76100.1 TonB periplasmic protein [Acetobacter malorum]OUJ07842.1 energy transducer TonB [Acetobacter malorum]
MTAKLSPSSRRRDGQEPRLVPPSAPGTARAATPPPAPQDGERDRLTASPTPVARPTTGYRRVKGTSTPIIRREVYAEPTIGPVLTASALAHFLLLGALLWQAAHHQPHGTPDGQQPSPVEMVFAQPESTSGMVGPHSDEAGGGNSGKAPSKAGQAEPTPAEGPPSPTVPSEETPATPPLPEADDGLSKSVPQPPKPVKAAHPPSGHKPQAHAVPRPTQHARPSQTPSRHAASPFDNPMDLSFNEAPAPRRSRHGRPGGSGGPIDLSVGPVVENGQINAHYTSRASVRGVSDDYGEQINEWIQRHMYYPEEAARNGEEGSSSVHVVLDRTGRVKSVYQTGSAGSYYLDAATSGMFRGSQLPPVPPDMKGNHFDIDLTINYILIRH